MPITKAAQKALRSSKKKKSFNNHRKTIMKGEIKKINKLLLDDKKDEAKKELPKVYKAIDKATKRGIIKKNTASRRKSSIAGAVFGK